MLFKLNCQHKEICSFSLHVSITAFIIITQNQLGRAYKKSVCIARSLFAISLLPVNYCCRIKAKTCIYNCKSKKLVTSKWHLFICVSISLLSFSTAPHFSISTVGLTVLICQHITTPKIIKPHAAAHWMRLKLTNFRSQLLHNLRTLSSSNYHF